MPSKRYIDFTKGVDIEATSKGVSSSWTRGLDGEEKEKFVKYLLLQQQLFDAQRDILETEYASWKREETKLENPNFEKAFWIAQGAKQAITKMHKLLPRPKEKGND
jgi:hypothetical protein